MKIIEDKYTNNILYLSKNFQIAKVKFSQKFPFIIINKTSWITNIQITKTLDIILSFSFSLSNNNIAIIIPNEKPKKVQYCAENGLLDLINDNSNLTLIEVAYHLGENFLVFTDEKST